MDHGEDVAVIVLPKSDILKSAQLFLESEWAGETVMNPECALCFEGEDEGFSHEHTLKVGRAWKIFKFLRAKMTDGFTCLV